MNERTILFQLPIYQEASSTFYAALSSKREQSVQYQVKRMRNLGVDSTEANALYQNLLQYNPLNPDRLAWNYNRIIGWIEFYADGRVTKGESVVCESKAYSQTAQKQNLRPPWQNCRCCSD